MAEINNLLAAGGRTLRLTGNLLLPTGAQQVLQAEDILRAEIDEGVDGALMPGDVLCANLSLWLCNDPGRWTAATIAALPGASISLSLEVLSGSTWHSAPLGVFLAEKVEIQEGQAEILVTGNDSISTTLSAAFTDSLTYPATLGDIWTNLVRQTSYEFSGSIPNGSSVVDRKPDWQDMSLRRAMGIVAAAAGCFLRIDRSGNLDQVRIWDESATEFSLDAHAYTELCHGSGSFGPLNRLLVETCRDEEGEAGTLTLRADAGIADSVQNTFVLKNNPLFGNGAENVLTLAQGMLNTMAGLTAESMEFAWRGDPSLRIGDRVCLVDTSGVATHGILSRQALRFDQGFLAQCKCAAPGDDSSDAERTIAPDGSLNANRLVGTVNGALIAAESITAEKIAAGSVITEKMAAHSVTADILESSSVSAFTVQAVAAKFQQIAAGSATTDELYAGLAEIVTLMVGEINADNITTDQLAAVLGDFVALYADTAGIDYAVIRDMVTDTAIITQGEADQLYVARLAVTEANIVSLTTGQLLITGNDGNLYALTVDDAGTVSTQLRQVTNGDIADGTIDAGTKILSGSITADLLNVQQIFASEALIGAIKAANLDVSDLFANEAFIASLNAWDIWSNDSMRLTVNKNDMNLWLRIDPNAGVEIGKNTSPVKMALDNEGWAIRDHGVDTAQCKDGKIVIKDGEFTGSIILGDFLLRYNSADGHVSLLKR